VIRNLRILCSSACLVVPLPLIFAFVAATFIIPAARAFIAVSVPVPATVPIPIPVPIPVTIPVPVPATVPIPGVLVVACGRVKRRGRLGSDIDGLLRGRHDGLLHSPGLPFVSGVVVTALAAFGTLPCSAISIGRPVAILSTWGLDTGFLHALLDRRCRKDARSRFRKGGEPKVGRPKGPPPGPILSGSRRDDANLSGRQADVESGGCGDRQADKKQAPKHSQGTGQA
jgi:hypothetical protein